MILAKYVERVRAAHALCFAMESGVSPRVADLRAVGLEHWTASSEKGRTRR